VNKIDLSSLRDEIKLRRSGELFYQGSVNLLKQVDAALENVQQQEADLTDTIIDGSFSQFLASSTQQSVSTSFLPKYLEPQIRTKYEREESTHIKSLTATEAVNLLEVDLIESEVISLAYDEDISAWIDRVRRCLETNPQIDTMLQIIEATNLSIAQVFISLLFSDYELVQRNNFYGEIEIKN
ncbi:MAG: hypothetical protein RLZZ574_556, partial [Cyanobacteriota bacterium]